MVSREVAHPLVLVVHPLQAWARNTRGRSKDT